MHFNQVFDRMILKPDKHNVLVQNPLKNFGEFQNLSKNSALSLSKRSDAYSTAKISVLRRWNCKPDSDGNLEVMTLDPWPSAPPTILDILLICVFHFVGLEAGLPSFMGIKGKVVAYSVV